MLDQIELSGGKTAEQDGDEIRVIDEVVDVDMNFTVEDIDALHAFAHRKDRP